MDGGVVAIIIACLLILAVVGLIGVAIAFLFKYAFIIIPTVIVAKIFGKVTDKNHKWRK